MWLVTYHLCVLFDETSFRRAPSQQQYHLLFRMEKQFHGPMLALPRQNIRFAKNFSQIFRLVSLYKAETI